LKEVHHSHTVLINATSAKHGGAETIVRAFIEFLRVNGNHQYIVLTGLKFNNLPKHIKVISKSTSGFSTISFATVGIGSYVKKYKPKKIISFTNLNYIIDSSLGITYFHQFKLLDSQSRDAKLRIYDWVIKRFLRTNNFVVQTELVKEKLIEKYPFLQDKVIDCWPGFLKEESDTVPSKNNCIGFMPIASIAAHKNIKLVFDLDTFWSDQQVTLNTCLPPDSSINTVVGLGLLSRKRMFQEYQRADFLFFPSKSETVGLPVFEFLQTGKPAFVFAAPYIRHLAEKFGYPENLLIFNDLAHFQALFLAHSDLRVPYRDYSKGEWEKLLASI
jgi:glycosyltransferase involved in cell wall biosynthesis